MRHYLASECRTMSRNEIIKTYFDAGFTYAEIQTFLSLHHQVPLSIRQLKRIINKDLNLKRKGQKSDLNDVLEAIENELMQSGSMIGYRAMHQRLTRAYGLIVDRETVRIVLGVVDPDGVRCRKNRRLKRRKYICKGPNYVWHIDGYDKLKPFGFCVHGAIDGYSRRILWLEVSSTNNNPKVIASYFLETLRVIDGTARIIRADKGTENVIVAGLQRYFRANSNDAFSGHNSFLYGRSVSNQRIEAWWSILRRSGINWWINYFKDLKDCALFDDSQPLMCACLQFCFMELIREDLRRIAFYWNTHSIRPYPMQQTPPGRPDVLFYLPELEGSIDYKVNIASEDLDIAQDNFCENVNPFGCKEDFSDVFTTIMRDNHLEMPKNTNEAEELYVTLLSALQ